MKNDVRNKRLIAVLSVGRHQRNEMYCFWLVERRELFCDVAAPGVLITVIHFSHV